MSEKRYALSAEQVTEALEGLPGWAVQAGKLHKVYRFKDFAAALAFMVAAGVQAEKMNHHPEWRNVYNRVTVDLVTHDLDNQISTLDVALARKMEQAATR